MPVNVKRSSRSSVNFIKIIRTKNLSEDICERIIAKLKSENIFRNHEGTNRGVTEEFILNDETNCDLDFLLINEEYSNIGNNHDYDDDNDNHLKLYKLNYVIQSSGESDHFFDVFFVPSFNLIAVNGSKNNREYVLNILMKTLDEFKANPNEIFDYDEINFKPKFVFWLIFKKNINSNLSDNLIINRFYHFATEDFPDEEGIFNPSSVPREISTADGENVITLPIIYGLLNDRDFSKLEGKFSYWDNKFEIRLEILPGKTRKSILFIKTKNILINKSYCDKIKFSLPFINDFVKIFEEWDSLEESEQYPNEKFINNLKTTLITEFNFTLKEYYNYKKDFNEKTKSEPEDLGKIISIHPKMDLSNIDQKTLDCIEYLVDKNVLLYL